MSLLRLPVQISDWREVWLVVDREEGTVVFSDEKAAREDADIYRENSGAPVYVLGPFKPTKLTKSYEVPLAAHSPAPVKHPQKASGSSARLKASKR